MKSGAPSAGATSAPADKERFAAPAICVDVWRRMRIANPEDKNAQALADLKRLLKRDEMSPIWASLGNDVACETFFRCCARARYDTPSLEQCSKGGPGYQRFTERQIEVIHGGRQRKAARLARELASELWSHDAWHAPDELQEACTVTAEVIQRMSDVCDGNDPPDELLAIYARVGILADLLNRMRPIDTLKSALLATADMLDRDAEKRAPIQFTEPKRKQAKAAASDHGSSATSIQRTYFVRILAAECERSIGSASIPEITAVTSIIFGDIDERAVRRLLSGQ